ncbi:MAG: hypothetical protein GY861_11420 [bacterium]|nr:hypothetical protein [bacterium]
MNDYYTPPADVVAGTRARSVKINEVIDSVDTAFDIVPDLNGLNSAVSSANFAGVWSALTGPASANISVYHLSQYWRLTTDILDITAKEPGTASEWVRSFINIPEDLGTLTGGTVDLDVGKYTYFYGTITTAETTFTFSNVPANGIYTLFGLKLTNPGTQTINYPNTPGVSIVSWPTTPNPTVSGRDTYVFENTGDGIQWDGYISSQIVV